VPTTNRVSSLYGCTTGSPSGVVHSTLRPVVLITLTEGLTLVHFSAQLERFVWDRGARRGRVDRVEGVFEGVFLCQTRLKLS
jgi:hypothetical protein